MRYLIPLALLTACDDGAVIQNPGGPGSIGDCELAGTEYRVATDSFFFAENLAIEGLSQPIDTQTHIGCVRSDGMGAAWLFQLNGQPYGLIRVEGDMTGPLVPTATNFVVDLYNASPQPLRATGMGMNGTVAITALDPFTAQGNTAVYTNGTAITVQFQGDVSTF